MFGVAADFGRGECAVFVEPREVGGKIPRDRKAPVVRCEEIEELCEV